MKQYITLNTTYYITKYNLSNPLFKIIFVIILTLVLRSTLDVSSNTANIAFCMDDSPVQDFSRTKRVTFDPNLPADDAPDSLEAYKKDALKQRGKVSLLRSRLSSAHTRLAVYADFKHHYADYMYQIERYKAGVEERELFIDRQEKEIIELIKENQRLIRDLNKVTHEASRFSRILNSLNLFKR